ncbi:MAG: zinc ribbon domain-containing protein, partial [Bacillota bacterium]
MSQNTPVTMSKEALSREVPLRELERELQALALARTQAHLKLAVRAYQLVRDGELQDPECLAVSSELKKVESRVFALRKEVQARKIAAKGLRCRNCQAPYSEGDRFCGSCGSALDKPPVATRACPECAAEVETAARYCPGCGHSIAPLAAVAPAASPDGDASPAGGRPPPH